MAVQISTRLDLGTDQATARQWLLHQFGPTALSRASFQTGAVTEQSVTFTRRYIPGWALVVGILTLPLGLLLLALVRNTDVLVFYLEPPNVDGRVIVEVVGAGPKRVEDLLQRLNREGVAMTPAIT